MNWGMTSNGTLPIATRTMSDAISMESETGTRNSSRTVNSTRTATPIMAGHAARGRLVQHLDETVIAKRSSHLSSSVAASDSTIPLGATLNEARRSRKRSRTVVAGSAPEAELPTSPSPSAIRQRPVPRGGDVVGAVPLAKDRGRRRVNLAHGADHKNCRVSLLHVSVLRLRFGLPGAGQSQAPDYRLTSSINGRTDSAVSRFATNSTTWSQRSEPITESPMAWNFAAISSHTGGRRGDHLTCWI